MATNAVLHHNTPIMTAQGLFHDLDIYPDHLVIRRSDIISRLFGHEEVIAYDDIKALHVYETHFLTNNWSQLMIVPKVGKSHKLTYGVTQRHFAQHIKEMVEDFMSGKA